MYTLEDLDFQPFQGRKDTEEARLTLKNGYIVKVLKGFLAAHTYGAPYEITVTPTIKEISEDSVGYLSEQELFKLINEIEHYPKLKAFT